MLYYFETIDELGNLRVDSIRIDLDIALTFAQIARQTPERKNAIRNQRNARKGYDAGLQFMDTANVTRFDREIIGAKLIRLKAALLSLGEAFSELTTVRILPCKRNDMSRSYAGGETLMIGDRISDERGRVGTVIAASDRGIFTIRWDDGSVGINYTVIEKFTLISRAVKSDEQT